MTTRYVARLTWWATTNPRSFARRSVGRSASQELVVASIPDGLAARRIRGHTDGQLVGGKNLDARHAGDSAMFTSIGHSVLLGRGLLLFGDAGGDEPCATQARSTTARSRAGRGSRGDRRRVLDEQRQRRQRWGRRRVWSMCPLRQATGTSRGLHAAPKDSCASDEGTRVARTSPYA